jgi:hypothetical protein
LSEPEPNPWDRRRLLIVIALGAALGVALIISLVSSTENKPSTAASDFAPVYEGLEERRQAAGVSTMGEPADPDAHLHPKLALYAEGEPIEIPVNIGIDPAKPGIQMASLHTHETNGTIHMEGMSDATLGQFFEIWGLPFSENELGPYEADGERSIRMWVGGKPSEEFEQLKLAGGQEIVVAYGTPDQLEEASP